MPAIDNHPRKFTTAAGAGGLAAGIALALSPLMAGEGLRTHAYIPVPGDRWTICYGETAGVHAGDVATPVQCKAMLLADVRARVDRMQRCLKVPVSPVTAQAMIRFAYNVGEGPFCKRVAANFNAGRAAAGCNWMRQFVWSGGRKYPGLVARRKGEADECLAGLS